MSTNEKNSLSVDFCLPIKNEALILPSNLEKLLNYCQSAGLAFHWRIIGVINGSTDNSEKIFQDFKNRYPDRIDYFVVKEAGRGQALKKYWALSPADVLAYMDADLAVALSDLPALVTPLINQESDLTIGSRLVAGAAVKRSWYRDIISATYNYISRRLLQHSFADLQCGFKAIRREAFRAISPYLLDDYWFFDTELVILAERLGYRVKEVPVDWSENRFMRRDSKVKVLKDSLTFLNNLRRFRRRLRQLKKYPDNA